MNRKNIAICLVFSLAFVFTGQVLAQDSGREDLYQATELKLTASSDADLQKVVQLCELALKKGLEDEDRLFAEQLLASTLVRRGLAIGDAVLRQLPTSPVWPRFRKMALADLERAAQLAPEQVDALQMIARLNLLPEGDKKRAREVLNKALELTKDDPPAQAKCLILKAAAEEKNQKKIVFLDQAIKTDPSAPEGWRMRGSLHAEMKNNPKALEDLRKTIELRPEQPLALLELGTVLFDAATATQPEDEEAKKQSEKLLDEAITVFQKTSELAPSVVQPLVQIAEIHAHRSELDKALEVLKKAAEIDPKSPLVLLSRAQVYEKRGDLDAALAEVDQVLKLYPNMSGNMLMRVKRYKAAIMAGSDKFGEAIDILKDLQKVSPEDALVALQLGALFSNQEKYAEAVKKYTQVLDGEPENMAALRLRGDAYLSLGKHPEALADLNKAAEMMPDDSGTLNNLAWLLCTSPDDKLRDGKRAVEMATKACELTDYKAAHILSTLAAAYAETGDMETARKWSEQAVELAEADANSETLEHLQDELKSYEQGNPWRELMTPAELDGPE